MSALFPPDFLESLAHLRIEARRVAPLGRHAEHHAREAGAGVEFRDYRAYAPGDDFRRIDWNLYRRFDRLFLKLMDEMRDLPAYVLVDVSDSMWLETPPRADAARRAAAVIAAVSLNQLDAVAIHPFGAALGTPLPAQSGKRSLPRVLAFLSELAASGRTDVAGAVHRFGSLPLRPGLSVVVSDFFDPRGLDRLDAALGGLRHRVVLVRIARATDRDPVLEGELRLVDCESADAVDVTVGDAVLRRYREAHAAFERALVRIAARRGAPLLVVDADRPVVAQFAPLFPGGVFRP